MVWIVGAMGCGAPAAPKVVVAPCHDRIELPEAAGECRADADCAAQGCSGEVCAAAGAEVMTPCDVQPCFAALDRCRCAEGRCTWAVR